MDFTSGLTPPDGQTYLGDYNIDYNQAPSHNQPGLGYGYPQAHGQYYQPNGHGFNQQPNYSSIQGSNLMYRPAPPPIQAPPAQVDTTKDWMKNTEQVETDICVEILRSICPSLSKIPFSPETALPNYLVDPTIGLPAVNVIQDSAQAPATSTAGAGTAHGYHHMMEIQVQDQAFLKGSVEDIWKKADAKLAQGPASGATSIFGDGKWSPDSNPQISSSSSRFSTPDFSDRSNNSPMRSYPSSNENLSTVAMRDRATSVTSSRTFSPAPGSEVTVRNNHSPPAQGSSNNQQWNNTQWSNHPLHPSFQAQRRQSIPQVSRASTAAPKAVQTFFNNRSNQLAAQNGGNHFNGHNNRFHNNQQHGRNNHHGYRVYLPNNQKGNNYKESAPREAPAREAPPRESPRHMPNNNIASPILDHFAGFVAPELPQEDDVTIQDMKPLCPKHKYVTQFMYCQTCSKVFCVECSVKVHEKHQTDNLYEVIADTQIEARRIFTDAKNASSHLKQDYERNNTLLRNVELKATEVMDQIRRTFEHTIQTLKARESELLKQVEELRDTKLRVLRNREKSFKDCINVVEERSLFLQDLSTLSNERVYAHPEYLIKWTDFVASHIYYIRGLRFHLNKLDDAMYEFEPPTLENFNNSMKTVAGHLKLPESAIDTYQYNNSYHRNYNYHVRENKHWTQNPNLDDPTIRPQERIPRGRPIEGCPNKIGLSGPMKDQIVQDYRFGGDGDDDSKLCRPWGIACDPDGRLIVADRSNNRIVIYSREGRMLHTFGSQGQQLEQFDRPAGVTVDSRKRIIVADKDNHRIQVFDFDGKFIFSFGTKGHLPGQFTYPWDVAVNSTCQIAVSDTRNHRVQLFSAEGVFLRKYSHGDLRPNDKNNPALKIFDSPRGIAFKPDGQIVVADFNNHRVLILDPDLLVSRVLIEYDPVTRNPILQRPQGLTVDEDGNIYVSDSKNNRVCMFDPTGALIWTWPRISYNNHQNYQSGSQSMQPYQNGSQVVHSNNNCDDDDEEGGDNILDRPAGISLTTDSRIAIIDFGKNEVLIL